MLDSDTKSFANEINNLEKSMKNTTGYNRFKPMDMQLSTFDSKKSMKSASSD